MFINPLLLLRSSFGKSAQYQKTYPDFDEQTCPGLPVEEEGEVSEENTSAPTQESDQQISEEQIGQVLYELEASARI